MQKKQMVLWVACRLQFACCVFIIKLQANRRQPPSEGFCKFEKMNFMDAVFRLNATEFDENFFHQIKNILDLKNNLEVIISISEQSTGILRQETKQEYFDRLLKAKENLDNNKNVIAYKADQFEEFEKFLLNEP